MSRALQPRPSTLADLLWSVWPFDVGAPLPGEGALALRVEEFVADDTLVVRAELPGVDPERDVEVSVSGGVLTISAERREERTQGTEGTSGYRSEFRYGSYRRSMSLPEGAAADDVSASYADGILEVRVPLTTAVGGPKKIEITRS